MYIVGIDENGFGPRLGVLTVTASLFELDEYPQQNLTKEFKDLGIQDSKKVLKFNQLSFGEEIVLTYFYLVYKKFPLDFDTFLKKISILKKNQLQEFCRGENEKMCYEYNLSLPYWSKTKKEELIEKSADLEKYFKERKIKLKEIKSFICCTHRFNLLIDEYKNKNHLEFCLLERIFEYYYTKFNSPLHFICGKIGSTTNYEPFFSYLKEFPLKEKEIGKQKSTYVFDKLGEVEFVLNAEDIHFPVAFSSIFGKYIRECSMERINQFYLKHLPSLKFISGYNDSYTKSFIKKTAKLREKLNISDDCFLRKK